MYHSIQIAWYGYAIMGACLGIYLHCHLIRHWLHWLTIRILRVFIWILKRTDPEYDAFEDERLPTPPNPKTPLLLKGNKQAGIEIGEAELGDLLSKNPDLSIKERTT